MEIEIREPISKKEIAEACYKKLENLMDQAKDLGESFVKHLYPIWKDELWRELGYKSWSHFIEQGVKSKTQSIWNKLKPYTLLLQSGLDPDEFSDINQSRVTRLALVAAANGGKLDPELISLAKKSKTRTDAKKFDEAIRQERQRLNIEDLRTIKILCEESQYEQWKEALQLFGQYMKAVKEPIPEGRIENIFMEFLLSEFLIGAIKFTL